MKRIFWKFYDAGAGGAGGGAGEKAALLAEIRTMISTGLETRASKAEIDAAIGEKMKEFKDLSIEQLRSMTDEKTGVMAILKAQGLAIAELENRSKGNDAPKTVREQILEWRKVNELALRSIKDGKKAELTPLEIRVNSPMTPSNTYNGSAYLPRPEFEGGANDIVRVAPTFWDYLKKGRTGSAAYVWVNKKNPLGAAGFIGPGVAKPGVSFELATEISNAKKIAATEKIALELLDDIEGFSSFVEDELRYQVRAKVNTTLMTGVSSTTVPAGIQTLSVPYSLTTIQTDNPNFMDCIRACVAQLRSGNLVGAATAFINPIDAANMDLTKANTSGVYLLPPFVTADGRSIGGATVVEDNNVAVGYVQVALLDYYKIKIYKDFAITMGWENDDFTKNLVTIIGEMRLHQIFSENFNGAFIYDSFADIQAAIAAA